VTASRKRSSQILDDGALRELAEILARAYLCLLRHRESRGNTLACSRPSMALLSDADSDAVSEPRKEVRS
jgi:hypothetical protein